MDELRRNSVHVALTDPATGQRTELPVLEGTLGPTMIDVRSVKQATGR